MEKVRFSCPRCGTLMQTNADKIGIDVACAQCQHQFRLVENDPSPQGSSTSFDSPTMPPRDRQPELESVPEITTDFDSPRINIPVGAQVPPAQPSWEQPATGRPPPYSQVPYSCPHCGTRRIPSYQSETAPFGWVFLAVGLASSYFLCYTFPIAFLGLLFRRRYKVCPGCKNRDF